MVTTSRILNTEYNGADVYRPRLIFCGGIIVKKACNVGSNVILLLR